MTLEPGGLAEFLDTNVVVRYLVRDEPELATRAAVLIESDRRLFLNLVVLAEIGYVLTSNYQIERALVVDTLTDFLNRANLDTYEVPTEVAIQALRFCRPSGRVSFGDAMIWAAARAATPARVWTFDRRFPPDGIERREP